MISVLIVEDEPLIAEGALHADSSYQLAGSVSFDGRGEELRG